MTGEESLSIVKNGKWVWKTYRPLDPRGIWQGEHFWRMQLERRVVVSRTTPGINPVRRWFAGRLVAVSRFIKAVRPTTEEDADEFRKRLPSCIGDVTERNIVISIDGPKLIDFCVNHV